MGVPKVKLEEWEMDSRQAKTTDILHHCIIIIVVSEFGFLEANPGQGIKGYQTAI